MYNTTNEKVLGFIKNNPNNEIVMKIKEANEKRDRAAFTQLLEEIKGIIKIKDKIIRHKRRIQSHVDSIEDIKSEIENMEDFIREKTNGQLAI